MKENHKYLTIFLFLLTCLVSNSETISGKVIKIADGDTITLLAQKPGTTGYTKYKIRLNGIDAPESNQAYGKKSKLALGSFLKGKSVSVKTTSKGRYGRHIGTVYADGEDANAWMVRTGWAWHYKKYSMKWPSKTEPMSSFF